MSVMSVANPFGPYFRHAIVQREWYYCQNAQTNTDKIWGIQIEAVRHESQDKYTYILRTFYARRGSRLNFASPQYFDDLTVAQATMHNMTKRKINANINPYRQVPAVSEDMYDAQNEWQVGSRTGTAPNFASRCRGRNDIVVTNSIWERNLAIDPPRNKTTVDDDDFLAASSDDLDAMASKYTPRKPKPILLKGFKR